MKAIEDPKKAEQMVQEKQQLEVNLAWELLDIFNSTKELIGPLRETAGLAIEEMMAIRDSIGPTAIDKAIAAEAAAMALLKKERAKSKLKDDGKIATKVKTVKKAKDLSLIADEIPKLDAQEISDVIRLYGTFVEEAAKDKPTADFYKEVETKKNSFRKGGDGVWNQEVDKKDFGRHRANLLKGQKALPEESIRDPHTGEVVISVSDLRVIELAYRAAAHEKAGRGIVQNFLVSMEGGQKVFALKDTSTIGVIDDAFGLVPASDISGTTADTMFFFSKYKGIDPIFHMLPLATIVAGAHHSTIEVALPLSLNGLMDYHIGFYSTLLVKSSHKAAGAIGKALQMAEKEALNHFILVWRDKKGIIAGCYDFEPGEAAFKKFANGKEALKNFKGMKNLDKAAIDGLVETHKLKGK